VKMSSITTTRLPARRRAPSGGDLARALAVHDHLAPRLGPEAPVAVEMEARDDRLEITIVAYDVFAEFSILCGLLASFGLDIESGHAHTVDAGPGSPATIVDLFRVRHHALPPARRRKFESELRALIDLLRAGDQDAARDRVSRRLGEYLGSLPKPPRGLLLPVEVRFDEESSPRWTVLDVKGRDTPAFLYAFSTALAVRGIYVHEVEIRSVGGQAHDRFLISDRSGRKIARAEQARLRMAVGFVKQFTHFLPGAPDPAEAMRYFTQFLQELLQQPRPFRSVASLLEAKSLAGLARLLGSRRFLWEDFVRMQLDNLLPALRGLGAARPARTAAEARKRLAAALRSARDGEQRTRALNRFKDREMFLIDLRQLVDPSYGLDEFAGALTRLTDVVVERALALAEQELRREMGRPRLEDGSACGFALFALGKYGGGEMGYASDLELIAAYSGEGRTSGPRRAANAEYFARLVRGVVARIAAPEQGLFHVDLRLRPHGRAGALASPLAALHAYYRPEGDAAPFERQALIKLRTVTGDRALARAVEAIRDRFVYSGEPWDLAGAVHLRGRQARELVRPGAVNVKYSPGGMVDVEYTAQYLQILHGRGRPALRTSATLTALDRLRALEVLRADEHSALRDAYRFLRRLTDGLRMVRGHARDLELPAGESDEFRFLARRLGYAEADWKQAAARLASDIRRNMGAVRRIFAARFVPPGSPERRLWEPQPPPAAPNERS
jgi:[glutamine synthetase] adenylyltransferase / [glutamine synthetase]-adenylyl-L-tyrosine phosphorylase